MVDSICGHTDTYNFFYYMFVLFYFAAMIKHWIGVIKMTIFGDNVKSATPLTVYCKCHKITEELANLAQTLHRK